MDNEKVVFRPWAFSSLKKGGGGKKFRTAKRGIDNFFKIDILLRKIALGARTKKKRQQQTK